MNPSLFHRYYEQQLNSMETNPKLRASLQASLAQRPTRKHSFKPWLVLGTASTLLALGIFTVVMNITPQSVTADALLRKALAAPTLKAGEIYQSSWTRISEDSDATTQTTISDGTRLEKLIYDEQHNLTGAELVIPQHNDRSVYDVYSYGSMRQFQNDLDANIIQHRVVHNIDVRDDVTSDDPSTFVNAPDGLSDSYGRNSVLEVVAGSSFWRPYVTNDVKHTSFFVEPIVTETELNGIPAYKLDERQDDIAFEVIGWISKEDGRLLQEQTVASGGFAGDLTVYSEPTITVGTMPITLDEFITTLGLTKTAVQDFDFTEFQVQEATQDFDISDCVLNEAGVCEPVSAE